MAYSVLEIKEIVFNNIIKEFEKENELNLANGWILSHEYKPDNYYYSMPNGYYTITTNSIIKAKKMISILKNLGFKAYWVLDSYPTKHQVKVKFKEVR